ncbi:hypothetical protein C1646_811480 [Rhizophagus diaphanus]|nr:hypothetical protein C1646_811480 [Rhizophagus diaphanus] [Rhizophagus sp. MUCL 43196]
MSNRTFYVPLSLEEAQKIKTACENFKLSLEWTELYLSKTVGPDFYKNQIKERKITRDDLDTMSLEEFTNNFGVILTGLKVTTDDQKNATQIALENKFYEWFDSIKLNPFYSTQYSGILIDKLLHIRDILQGKGEEELLKRLKLAQTRINNMGEHELNEKFNLLFVSYNNILNKRLDDNAKQIQNSSNNNVYSSQEEIVNGEIKFNEHGNAEHGKKLFEELEEKYKNLLV